MTTTTKSKSTKSKKSPKGPPRASDKKRKATRRAKPAAGAETSTAIVRRHFESSPKRTFSKVVELAVADGVNRNTARGALVRIKQAAAGAKA